MEELTKLLAEAATKLGIEAARLWPQLVLITFIKSAFWSAVLLLFLATGPLIWVSRFRFMVVHWDEEDIDFPTIFVTLSVLITFPFIGLIALVVLPNQLAGVFVPEAITVLDLLKQVKP